MMHQRLNIPQFLVLHRRWLIVFAAALSISAYVGASSLFYRTGFPLDDAWIHQTYARNLALHGEWSFIPGQPSAGSTSPLWTILLAPGFWMGLSPYIWTYLLSWAALAGVGLAGISIFGRIFVVWRSL